MKAVWISGAVGFLLGAVLTLALSTGLSTDVSEPVVAPGRGSPAPQPMVVLPRASRSDRPVRARRRAPSEDVDEIAAVLAECEAEVDQLHLELYGEPLQWTDDIPEVQREAPFREVMAAVEDQCGGRPMSHLDCSEPPCMAVYFGSAPQIGADCEPWAEAYGVASSNMSRRVECADGRQMRMVVLSPTAEAYASGEEMMARGAQRDPAVREQRSVRMNHRWNELALDIPCPAL